MAEGQQFEFPMLDVKEIVPQLRNIGNIFIEETDFKRPDPNRWAKLYPQILESLTGVSFESMLQNSMNVSTLEHPELYEEALPQMILSLALSRVLRTCGIKDFSIADIHEPRSQRCIKIGSAVVNFILFKQHQTDVFKNLKEANKRSAKQFDHVVKMNDELKMKVNSIKSTRAEQEPEIVRVQQNIQARLVTLNEMEKVKNEKQKAISEVKACLAEKQAAMEKVKVMILKTKEEIEKLSLKIVQSPERVKEDQENMKQKVVNMKCGLDQKWILLEEMQQRLETVIQGTATMDKVLKLLMELQTNIDNENQISGEINQIVDKCQEQRTTLSNLRARKDQLQQIIAGRMEKRDKLSLQHQNKIQSLLESVQTLQQQKDLFQQRFDSDEAQKSELRKQEQQIIDSVNEECRLWERKKENIMGLYRQILERVDNNHKDLGSGWEALLIEMQKVLQQQEKL